MLKMQIVKVYIIEIPARIVCEPIFKINIYAIL